MWQAVSLEASPALELRGDCCFDGTVFLATDGSVVDTVAAWAVVLDNGGGVFSLGVDAEDQSPYRAETEGLIAVVRALHRLHGCWLCPCVGGLSGCIDDAPWWRGFPSTFQAGFADAGGDAGPH